MSYLPAMSNRFRQMRNMDAGIFMKRCPVYYYARLKVPIVGNYIYGVVATFPERKPKWVQYKGKAWNYMKH